MSYAKKYLNKNEKFAEILYQQDSDAIEILDLIDDNNLEKLEVLINQYDYGEYHNQYDSLYNVIGKYDQLIVVNNYLVFYNAMLNYVSVFCIINEFNETKTLEG